MQLSPPSPSGGPLPESPHEQPLPESPHEQPLPESPHEQPLPESPHEQPLPESPHEQPLPKLSFNIKATQSHKKRPLLSTQTPTSTTPAATTTPAPASVAITSFSADERHDQQSQNMPAQEEAEIIIPALPNTFLPHKKSAGEKFAQGDGADHDIVAVSDNVADDDNLPAKKKQRIESHFDGFGAEDERHGDDSSDSRVSIEAFGKAMLRGMGWRDGEGIGRNKQLVQPVVAKARPKLAGIGSNLTKIRAMQKEQRRMSSSRTPSGTPRDVPRGEESTYKTLEDKLLDQKPQRLQRDAIVAVVSGPHEGLIARVLRVIPQRERLLVRLNLNRLEVRVHAEDVELLDLSELDELHEARKFARQEPAESGAMDEEDTLFLDEYKYGRRSSKSERGTPPSTPAAAAVSSGKDHGKRHAKSVRSKSSAEKDRKSKQDLHPVEPWLMPHIRVRVISKTFHRGKYYQQKGVVVDVPDIDVCTLRMDSGNILVDDVSQDMLETVIPKAAHSHVMCVAGKYRGKRAIMMDRSRRKQICYLHLLDDADEQHLVPVHFDDVSEYVRMNT